MLPFWLLPHGQCLCASMQCCHWSSFPVYPSQLYIKYGSMQYLALQSIFTPYIGIIFITPSISNIMKYFQVLYYSQIYCLDLPSDHKSQTIDHSINFCPLPTVPSN